MNDWRRQIMAEARQHLADKAEIERDLAERLMRAPAEDKLTKWRREMAELEAGRERERKAMKESEREIIRQHQEAQWEAWLDRELDAYTTHERGVIADAIDTVVNALEARLNARIDALEAKQRGVVDGEILDLPRVPLLRKVKDNAA